MFFELHLFKIEYFFRLLRMVMIKCDYSNWDQRVNYYLFIFSNSAMAE